MTWGISQQFFENFLSFFRLFLHSLHTHSRAFRDFSISIRQKLLLFIVYYIQYIYIIIYRTNIFIQKYIGQKSFLCYTYTDF